MIDLFMDSNTDREFYLKMLIAGLENELQKTLSTVEERKIMNQIEEAKKELAKLNDN